MKIKNRLTHHFTLGLACLFGVALSSCEDFLDREPLDRITVPQFFNTEADLAAYSVAYYPSTFSTHSGWGIGVGNYDNHTDNQATTDANLYRYVKGHWKVPQSGDLGFGNIRAFNYFFEQVLPKYEQNAITGSPANIEHYIGEVYFLRAMTNFQKLQTYGDFPIITSVLEDNHEALVEAAKRAPRNLFARFILEDLDRAIDMLQDGFKKKNRLTRDAALLAKSRVALYEGTFLKHHRGTPRVPGEAGWPGAKMSYNSGFTIDLDGEINFFLTQAMAAAKEVADKVSLTPNSGKANPEGSEFAGWNPYFEMFAAQDMSNIDEVLFWRDYSLDLSVTHGVSVYLKRGGNTGLTKGMVDSYLMKNGLPIYAAGSGYVGDETIMKTKEGRDERLQMFVAGETDRFSNEAENSEYGYPGIVELQETRDVTGYRPRKFLSFDPKEAPGSELTCTAGSIVFRAVEAYLNYMEACYEKNGTLDGDATNYWVAIRKRAGVDTDFAKTIANTDLSRENDWGAYSGGVLVDATLYNIRRERRNEFISEGLRWADLMRWCSMNQVKNYVVEGFNLWDEAYLAEEYYTVNEEGETEFILVGDGSASSNVSAKELSKYLRPYQKIRNNNPVFDGYNWSEANYLSPLPIREIQLASPDKLSIETSNLYQNPYWPLEANGEAER